MWQVAWSADPQLQSTVDLLAEHGLILACDETGFRAVTVPSATSAGVLGGLIRSGFRFKGSGPQESPVGELRGGRRPGAVLEVVRRPCRCGRRSRSPWLWSWCLLWPPCAACVASEADQRDEHRWQG